MTASERVYRRLMQVYPRSFRARYEEEMVRLFLDQLRDARRSSRTRDEAALWLRSVGDIVSSAPAEHLRREEGIVAKPVEPGSVTLSVSSGMTGQQRFGYAVAGLPFILMVILQLVGPGFMEPIFANPPAILGLPAGIVMMFAVAIWASLAFVVIRAFRSGFGIAVALLVFTVPSMIAILYLPATILIILNLSL